MLKRRSSSRMLCFSLSSSAKRRPRNISFSGQKDGRRWVLNQDCMEVEAGHTAWDSESTLSVELLQRSATVNAERYVQTSQAVKTTN